MPKTTYLLELTGGLVEIEAENAEEAESLFDSLIAPLAAFGTLAYRGPRTEDEYERDQARMN